MRAVNLIPADERRGAGGAGGRSGGGAYVLLGALVAMVVMVAAYAMTTKSVNDRRNHLAEVVQKADATEARAASLASYAAFKQMRTQRVETVKSIAASRFEWAHAMHELARTLPNYVTLTTMRGTVNAATTVQGGASVSIRGALPNNPAIELTGCVPSQSDVARMLVNLRRIDGVRRVSLQQAEKSATPASAGSATAPAAANCDVLFQGVVFYDPAPAVSAPAAATAASTTASSTTTGATR